MKLNGKRVTLGVVALGLAGGLAAGGVALAAPGAGPGAGPVAAETAATPAAGPGGCGGMSGAMPDMMFGENSPMTAAAKYLGVSRTDLVNQMHSGKSLADIAEAHGKSLSGLKDTMLAAMKRNLDANTALSAAQKARMLAEMTEHIDAMLTTTHMSGSGRADMGSHMGQMGSHMGGGSAGMGGHARHHGGAGS